ncbi:hypothetical protein ALC62_13525 [Cyphomyrmex costatus]|uniref:Peptidase aspartic putative domain-containing protein n=1 Tax=Cyphomyrmex costatus TaxID=456900 RepID=A0A151I9S4_9HYME|nr:hypothetical protein ALC62_13525 [Cyphomyrmex costatus]
MSTFDEQLSMQNQYMSAISRTLTNFKKLGQAKMTPAVTRQRLATLKETFARCQELDSKLTLFADGKLKETHAYFTQSYFLQCEDYYNEAADFMAEVLATHESRETPLAAHDVSEFHTSFRSMSKLPRINLPMFDGTFEKWESFRDKFKSMIYDDCTLTNVDRMHYLSSCVEGSARNALDHLAVTNSNFEIAWNILLSRYDNKRRLITTHLTSFFNLPTCTNETSNNLRNIRDQTNKAIQALSNLGCATEHWDDLLVFLVAQKLDKSSRKAWELKLSDAVEYPSYHEFDSFLAARIRALDALAPATQNEKSPPNSKKRTLASHTASAAPFSCTLCKENHLLYQCPTFLKQTPSQRFEFIKTQKRCSNCFGVKHSVKDCKSTRACKRCSKRHHTLLHFDASAPHVESEQPSTTTPASSENSTHITSHLISKTVAPKSQILLATALIRVYSPHNRFITVRALLDQGSVSTEEVPQPEIRSPEEHQCEEHFRTTHSRTPEGRYVVRLPFKNGPPISLGESRQNAITSLHRLDRRLCRDPRKASEYSDFLAEYETLGHMTKSSLSEIANQEQAYYIPHHAVLCDSSATTRLRVVFNASCRTSNGLSLNDHMLIGPKLQKDLAAILLQWRQYRYVFIADIAKMYRQILIDPRNLETR